MSDAADLPRAVGRSLRRLLRAGPINAKCWISDELQVAAAVVLLRRSTGATAVSRLGGRLIAPHGRANEQASPSVTEHSTALRGFEMESLQAGIVETGRFARPRRFGIRAMFPVSRRIRWESVYSV